jgi:hypothetical protein
MRELHRLRHECLNVSLRYARFLRSESKVPTVDVLIVIPLIPRAPVVITWWLPWESWIPKKIPQYVLGP